VREENWKLIRPIGISREPELYHLIADPHEEKDLAAREPGRVQRLSRLLEQWQKHIRP
jgi:hypothetical protein